MNSFCWIYIHFVSTVSTLYFRIVYSLEQPEDCLTYGTIRTTVSCFMFKLIYPWLLTNIFSSFIFDKNYFQATGEGQVVACKKFVLDHF